MEGLDPQDRALVAEDVAESKAYRILDSQLAAEALSHEQCVRRRCSAGAGPPTLALPAECLS